LKLHENLQRGIEKAFFGGKTTGTSVRMAYITGNIILMFVLFYFLLFQIGFEWVGQLHPLGSGIRLDFLFGGLDDAIPYIPETVIFYLFLFLPMALGTMLYFAFSEYKMGYALGWSLVTINAVALVVYVILPVSVYGYHQFLLDQPTAGDFWAGIVYDYVEDLTTPFNCFPSLHASVSTISFYTWYRYSKIRTGRATKIAAIASLVIAVGIVLSTLFLKQHYIADEIAGIALAWGVGRSLFNHFWKPFRATGSLANRNMKK
jgi:membrane-associated phospholipid phosphatase